jgi:hypothetical protein
MDNKIICFLLDGQNSSAGHQQSFPDPAPAPDPDPDPDVSCRGLDRPQIQVDLTLTPPLGKAPLPVDLTLTPPYIEHSSIIDLTLTPLLMPMPLEEIHHIDLTADHPRALAMDLTLTPPPPGQPRRPINLRMTPPAVQHNLPSMDLTLTPSSSLDLSLSPPNSSPAHIPDSPIERAVQRSNPDADILSGSAPAANAAGSADASGSANIADPEFLTFCNKEVEPPLTLTYVGKSASSGKVQLYTIPIPSEPADASVILGSLKLVDLFEEDGVYPSSSFTFCTDNCSIIVPYEL